MTLIWVITFFSGSLIGMPTWDVSSVLDYFTSAVTELSVSLSSLPVALAIGIVLRQQDSKEVISSVVSWTTTVLQVSFSHYSPSLVFSGALEVETLS